MLPNHAHIRLRTHGGTCPKVDALMILCDRLEAALTLRDPTRARLLEALLHEALRPGSKFVEAAE